MARLQRKKTVSAKKKKQKKAVAVALQQVKNDGAVKQMALPLAAVKESKKSQVSPPKKTVTKIRTEPGKIKNYLDISLQFLREVKVELKKVTWPTRKQTMSSTVVVIILVMIISLFLGVIDVGLSSLLRLVLK
ncbi:MAG: preprotein translocase subunit SecE [Candidatus Desulfatibia sp.]|uniref:preprotein translocase subunit SecE n=1 Tax=Candidatus Desulfatibia sp. TaxID=3101189 RepID=UPI002F2BCC8E